MARSEITGITDHSRGGEIGDGDRTAARTASASARTAAAPMTGAEPWSWVTSSRLKGIAKYDSPIEIRSAQTRRAPREEHRNGQRPDDRDGIGDQDRRMIMVNDVEDAEQAAAIGHPQNAGTRRPASRRRSRIRNERLTPGFYGDEADAAEGRVQAPSRVRRTPPDQIARPRCLSRIGGADLGSARSREHEQAASEEHHAAGSENERQDGEFIGYSAEPQSTAGERSGLAAGASANERQPLAIRQNGLSREPEVLPAR